MKKGASTAIITVLVMLITVSLILMSYQWLLKSAPETQQELENSLPQKEGCLKIENIDTLNKKITVRNCGKTELNSFVVYLDSKPIANYSGKLDAGYITQINYDAVIASKDHEIKVSSDRVESNKITFYISTCKNTQPPENGNWTINSDVSCICSPGENITINGKIFIMGSATFNVTNCFIQINTDSDPALTANETTKVNIINSIFNVSSKHSFEFTNSVNYVENSIFYNVASGYNIGGSTINTIKKSQFLDYVHVRGPSETTFEDCFINGWNSEGQTGTSIVRGNFTFGFNKINEWTSDVYISRYIPTIVEYADGSPVTGTANVTDKDGSVIWQGNIANGYAEPMITFNSTNYGPGNFTLRVSDGTNSNSTDINFIMDTTLRIRLGKANIIWFKFNEANGTTVYDSSGNGNNGVFLGETFNDGRLGDATCNPGSGSCPTRTSNGYFGKALIFDGTNDYVKTPLSNDFDFGDEDFTIGFWMKGDYQYGYGYFFSKNYVSGSGIRWYGCSMVGSTGNGEPANAGKIRLYVNNGTTLAQADTSGYYNDSVWHHVALRRNTSSKKLEIFVDGSPDGVYNNFYGNLSNMTSSPQNNFFVGARSDLGTGSNARYFNGTIDEFRVWNRALNITEINSEMQSSLSAIRPLVSWRFEEDISSNYTNDTHIWVNGTYGSALSFENDSVSVTDIPNTSLTVMAWIYPQQILGVQRAIVSKWKYPNAANNEWLIRLSNDSTAKIELYIRNITGDQVYTSTTNFIISPNQWSHIAVVYDRETGQVSFYKSGSPVSGGGYVGATWDTAEIVRVGAQGGGTYNYFNGTIDEVKIFNRTLSASEIVTEMNKP